MAKQALDKNECKEIFMDCKIDGENMYEPIATGRRVELKFVRQKFINVY